MKAILAILALYPVLMWAQVTHVVEVHPPQSPTGTVHYHLHPSDTVVTVVPSVVSKQYVGIHLGTDYCFKTNASNSGLKVGVKTGIVYGYKFDLGFRAEVEATFRRNSFATKYVTTADDTLQSKRYHSLHSYAYLGNLYYDVPQLKTYQVVPYVGVGFGYAQATEKVKYKTQKISHADKFRDDRFVYQGILGARYAINEQLDMSLEYKYFCGLAHAKDHSISLALLRNF